MTILLFLLLAIDGALLTFIIYQYRQNGGIGIDFLAEVSEERTKIKQMISEIRTEFTHIHSQCHGYLEKITHIAAEAELESKQQNDAIAQQIELSLKEVMPQIEKPLAKISEKQMSLESLLKNIDKERLLLTKLINRGERLLGFFNKEIPYEKVLEEIEVKKYSDARQLLAKGYSITQISKELGMTSGEVELVRNMVG